MDFSEIIIVVGSFIAGYLYREFILVKDLLKISKNFEKNFVVGPTPDSPPTTEIQRLRYETVDGVNYWYNESDNTFVCQGSTFEEAAKHWTLTQGPVAIGFFIDKKTDTVLCFANNSCTEFSRQ